MDYHYAYLLGNLYFLAIWILIFWKYPSYRKAMLIFGVGFCWLGAAVSYFWWTEDWWHPETLSGTRIGIEDFLLSFTHISIPVLIYKIVFRKDVVEKLDLSDRKILKRAAANMLELVIASFIVSFALIHWTDLTSFWATILGMASGGSYVILRRKDLMQEAIWSAVLMFLISLPVYIMGNLAYPDVVAKFWDFSGISGFLFLGIPIEDLVWYAALGFFLGPSYEFLFGFTLRDRKIILNK